MTQPKAANDSNTTRIAILENTVSHIHEKLERIDKRIMALDEKLDNRFMTLNERLEERFERLDSRLWILFVWTIIWFVMLLFIIST